MEDTAFYAYMCQTTASKYIEKNDTMNGKRDNSTVVSRHSGLILQGYHNKLQQTLMA